MRLVFLGSPPFATPVLQRLLDSPYRPELVVTPPPRRRGRGRTLGASPVGDLARASSLALEEPESVKDPAFMDRLRAQEADVFLVVSYGELLREEFLEIPKLACLNVHPSLLPRWRGASPIQSALRAGDRVTGVSIQRVVLELDAGDVLVAREAAIEPDETAGELAGRLAGLSGDLCVEALDLLAGGDAIYTPQDPDDVVFCKKLTKEDGAIDWSKGAVEIERLVRAMNPWPVASTHMPDGKPLAIWRSHLVPGEPDATQAEAGTLVSVQRRLIVNTGSGLLELDTVQVAGKRAMEAEEYLRGARLEPGQRLG